MENQQADWKGRGALDRVAEIFGHVSNGGPFSSRDGDEAISFLPDLMGARDSLRVHCSFLGSNTPHSCYVHFANERSNSTPNGQNLVLRDRLIHELVNFGEDEFDVFVGHIGLVFHATGSVGSSDERARSKGQEQAN